jgi:hypothetical protein
VHRQLKELTPELYQAVLSIIDFVIEPTRAWYNAFNPQRMNSDQQHLPVVMTTTVNISPYTGAVCLTGFNQILNSLLIPSSTSGYFTLLAERTYNLIKCHYRLYNFITDGDQKWWDTPVCWTWGLGFPRLDHGEGLALTVTRPWYRSTPCIWLFPGVGFCWGNICRSAGVSSLLIAICTCHRMHCIKYEFSDNHQNNNR